MELKQKSKRLFQYLYLLFKAQPLIFITAILSFGYGMVTMITGSIKLSYFIGVTGACALIFAAAKFYALSKYATINKQQTPEYVQYRVAKNIALSASVMSFLHFGISVVCTFFEEESPSNYGFWFIIFVGGAAFTKIILSTVNAVRTRKNHNVIIHNIKLVDNANALIALGLTQRAIIYYVGDEAARWASGIGGIFFSLCAMIVCSAMFLKYRKVSAAQETSQTAVTENIQKDKFQSE